VKHEYYEKPVLATAEIKAPIVEHSTLKTEHFVEENFQEVEKHKKGFGSKIKALFSGNDHKEPLHDNLGKHHKGHKGEHHATSKTTTEKLE